MKNYFLFVFTLLFFLNSQAQQKLTLKTTESYLVKTPATYGDFQHNDEFMTWQLDFNNKKITYNNGKLTKTFHFTNVEANPNSTAERNIYNFENDQDALTLITTNSNYLKIKIYSDKVPNTNPVEHRTVNIYTNYIIDDFIQLLTD